MQFHFHHLYLNAFAKSVVVTACLYYTTVDPVSLTPANSILSITTDQCINISIGVNFHYINQEIARWIAGNSDYPSSVTPINQDLAFMSLDQRRDIALLCLYHK